MEFSIDEKRIQIEAIEYIKSNKEALIHDFILKKKPLPIPLFAFFMAGSPGAGKTEFAKRYMRSRIDKKNKAFIKLLKQRDLSINDIEHIFIRIDVDEIRDFLPQYRKTDIKNKIKGNSEIIQPAASKGLDYLRNYCLDNGISFLHDGTFSNYSTLRKIIKKCIKDGRIVQIFYIYLDPLFAWDFTKAREALEGRNIVKEKFIEQFFKSRENVDRIKEEFGDKVAVHCILKNDQNEVKEIALNQSSIANFLELKYSGNLIKGYSPGELLKILN